MTRIFQFTRHFPPAEVVTWWNDAVAMIDNLLSSSALDPYVVFASLTLLECYTRSTAKPIYKLDTYRLFVASLMVASKIICPRHTVPWTEILGDTFMEESVYWSEREFLITILWDQWMMEIVDEVWKAYDRAVEERRGERQSQGRCDPRGRAASWASSITSVSGYNSDGSSTGSTLFPPPILLTPLRRPSEGGIRMSRLKTTSRSSLWDDYMMDRSRPASSDTDMGEHLDAVCSAAYVEKPAAPRVLRTRLSRMFNKSK